MTVSIVGRVSRVADILLIRNGLDSGFASDSSAHRSQFLLLHLETR